MWYFPVGNKEYSGWEGGIIGSVGVNDYYIDNENQHFAAFIGIDGFLYVVNHTKIYSDSLSLGPDSITKYPVPELVYKYK